MLLVGCEHMPRSFGKSSRGAKVSLLGMDEIQFAAPKTLCVETTVCWILRIIPGYLRLRRNGFRPSTGGTSLLVLELFDTSRWVEAWATERGTVLVEAWV